MRNRRSVVLAAATVLATAVVIVGGRVEAQVVVKTRAGEVSRPVDGSAVLQLPFAAEHLAVHWAGNPEAQVKVALSTDGTTFGSDLDVALDEVGEHRGNGETYGAIQPAERAVAVRVSADRPIGRVTALALADGERITTYQAVPAKPAGAAVAQPTIKSRLEWGADEKLRFDANNNEVWPPEFHPVQKLIVHHTAGANNDPDPMSTIRSIYYYHAVTQGWGDIGYNFLIDEAGNIYKGRHSHSPGLSEDTITGENSSGYGVTAGHSYGFNSGTVGVALLGTLTRQDAKPAAKSALVDFLAWKAEAHGIGPNGSEVYTNPVNGSTKTFANIAGHRDVSATECPGDVFYAGLPSLRNDVETRITGVAPSTTTTTTTVKKGGRKR